MNLPNHIAIIMDGNGRWGEKNFGNRLAGHKCGIENIKNILKYCIKKKISNLTLYAFSKDNLKRSVSEISNLFNLFEKYFLKNEAFFDTNKILIRVVGEKENLPKTIVKLIKKINKKKINKKKINLNIAFNYSSKLEIIKTIKKILFLKKKITIKNIDNNLYTSKSKNPEILIRTGARSRLSDFLLWQISYCELFFVKKMWPDFKSRDLDSIIKKFYKIKRNFGS
jgi:undecaprenyl diphosphate synthase